MLVNLNGPTRIGKTHTANYLVEHWGFTKLNLARTFKSYVAESLGISLQTLDDIKDHVFHPDNSHHSIISSPTIREMFTPEEVTIRELCIEAANLVERVDSAAWVRIALKDIDISNGLYVLDSIGKMSQWSYIVHNYHPDDFVLWRLGYSHKHFNCFQFEDGRHGISKGDVIKKTWHSEILNYSHQTDWVQNGGLEDGVVQEPVKIGVAN